jgi:hypothetical protein
MVSGLRGLLRLLLRILHRDHTWLPRNLRGSVIGRRGLLGVLLASHDESSRESLALLLLVVMLLVRRGCGSVLMLLLLLLLLLVHGMRLGVKGGGGMTRKG